MQSQAKHMFSLMRRNSLAAPFGGVGEEGGNSSKYASYELPDYAA